MRITTPTTMSPIGIQVAKTSISCVIQCIAAVQEPNPFQICAGSGPKLFGIDGATNFGTLPVGFVDWARALAGRAKVAVEGSGPVMFVFFAEFMAMQGESCSGAAAPWSSADAKITLT
jgi:hypothetical protein